MIESQIELIQFTNHDDITGEMRDMHRRPKNPDTIQENGKVEGACAYH